MGKTRKKKTQYQQFYGKAVKFLPTLFVAGREAGIKDSTVIGLFKLMGTYFTALSEVKTLDELPRLLNTKRIKDLDTLILKGIAELSQPTIRAAAPFVLAAKFMARNHAHLEGSIMENFGAAIAEFKALMGLEISVVDETPEAPAPEPPAEPKKDIPPPPQPANVISFEDALAQNRVTEYLAQQRRAQ